MKITSIAPYTPGDTDWFDITLELSTSRTVTLRVSKSAILNLGPMVSGWLNDVVAPTSNGTKEERIAADIAAKGTTAERIEAAILLLWGMRRQIAGKQVLNVELWP